jgi:TonB family protein
MAKPISLLPEETGRQMRNAFEEAIPVPSSVLPVFMTSTKGWSKDKAFGWTQAISVGLHAALVALLTVPFIVGLPAPIRAINTGNLTSSIPISRYLLLYGGGGGGDHSLTPPGKGEAPEFSATQLTSPTEIFRNSRPILPVKPKLLGLDEIQIADPNMDHIGDPQSKFAELSNGTGSGSGIGNGHGSGIGDGNGPGLGLGSGGGAGGDAFRPGENGVSHPSCSYMPNPPYSEEARKAKYSGVVLVDAVISADGKVTLPRVVKSPGLGLNETTVQTMQTWRCQAALGPGRRPVPTRVTFEVNFRLY